MNNKYFDIHSHVLWGMDDGAQSLQTSVELCDMAVDSGTGTLFLTPHLMYWETCETLYDKRERRFEGLSEILDEEGIPLDIKKGFEILCDDDIFDIKYFKPYTLCGSRYILIEFDFFKPTYEDVNAWCDYLKSFGLVPIIAHPERYDFFLNDYSAIDKLSQKGNLFQVNSGSAAGMFGDEVQDFAVRMINCGFADFVGSDAHDIRIRNTDIAFCLENYPYGMNEEVIEKALFINPQAIINDEQLKTKRLCYFAEM